MKYNTETCAIELSVRELCDRACRRGDLDKNTYRDMSALLKGGEIHRKLQRDAGVFYDPEVSLLNTTVFGNICFTVSGRADGKLREPEGVMIDEIKCVRGYDFFAPPRTQHLAQLKCYAYFYAVREDLGEIRGRITYYNIDNGKVKYYRYNCFDNN